MRPPPDATYNLDLVNAPAGDFHVSYHDRKLRGILAGGEIGPLVEKSAGRWLGQLVDGRHIAIAAYSRELRIGIADSAVAAVMATNPRGDSPAVALCPWPPLAERLTLDQALELADDAGVPLHYYYAEPGRRWASIEPIMRAAGAVTIAAAQDFQPCDSCGQWAAGVASFVGRSGLLLMSVPLCEQHLDAIPPRWPHGPTAGH
jgi:hypothetical protein